MLYLIKDGRTRTAFNIVEKNFTTVHKMENTSYRKLESPNGVAIFQIKTEDNSSIMVSFSEKFHECNNPNGPKTLETHSGIPEKSLLDNLEKYGTAATQKDFEKMKKQYEETIEDLKAFFGL